jgi:hypothetical protein
LVASVVVVVDEVDEVVDEDVVVVGAAVVVVAGAAVVVVAGGRVVVVVGGGAVVVVVGGGAVVVVVGGGAVVVVVSCWMSGIVSGNKSSGPCWAPAAVTPTPRIVPAPRTTMDRRRAVRESSQSTGPRCPTERDFNHSPCLHEEAGPALGAEEIRPP